MCKGGGIGPWEGRGPQTDKTPAAKSLYIPTFGIASGLTGWVWCRWERTVGTPTLWTRTVRPWRRPASSETGQLHFYSSSLGHFGSKNNGNGFSRDIERSPLFLVLQTPKLITKGDVRGLVGSEKHVRNF